MAGDMSIGGLVGELMLRDKDFTSKLNKAGKLTHTRTAQMKKQLGGVAKSLAGLAGIAGLGGIARSSANLADTIQKGAQRAGLMNDEFQRLSRVVELGGGSMSSFENAAKELNDEIGRGGDKLAKYGIQIKNLDGSEKSLRQVFGEVSDALKDSATQADRVRMARDLMSRSGVDLLPVMQQGNAAIVAQGDSVKIMTDRTIEQLNKAKDAWSEFSRHLTIQSAEIGTNITKIVEDMGRSGAEGIFGSQREILREQAEKQARRELGIDEQSILSKLDPKSLLGRDKFRQQQEERVQQRTREILKQNRMEQFAGEQAQKREMDIIAGKEKELRLAEMARVAEEARAKELDGVASKIEKISAIAAERIRFERLGDSEKLAELGNRMNELRGIQGDESMPTAERLAAAEELAKVQMDSLRLEERMAKAIKTAASSIGSVAYEMEAIAKELSLSDIAQHKIGWQGDMARRAMELQERAMVADASGRSEAAGRLRDRAGKLESGLELRRKGYTPDQVRSGEAADREAELESYPSGGGTP